MPAEFELCVDERIVYSRAQGDVDDAVMAQHIDSIRELFSDGSIDATWAQIFDFTEVESLESITSNGIQNFARQNPWPKQSLRVFVLESKVTFGLTRMYQILAGLEEKNALKITKTLAEARNYIRKKRSSGP